MAAEAVAAKFRVNAGLALDDAAVAALETAVRTLEEQEDVARCLGSLRTPAIQRS
jgi:hypothetical protein